MLLDFGAGHFRGAPTLTREVLPLPQAGVEFPQAGAQQAGPQESNPLWAPGGQEPNQTCTRCGGNRRVLAWLTARPAVRSIREHLGLPWQVPRLSAAQGPPQSTCC